MTAKYEQILVIVVVGALTIGSMSVTGLLQSTERIGASGLIVRPFEEELPLPSNITFTPSPPEPKVEIDVYSNEACTNPLSNVEWGEIEVGGDSKADIYVLNKGETRIVISLDTENWSSTTTENNMRLSWDYNGSQIEPGEVLKVTLTLSVDDDCPELVNFGFDIVIIGS